jgi:hypothetical protein
MEACRPMYEYSWLIDRIRENSRSMGIEKAAVKAMEEMPADFGIRDFLLKNKEEVQMSMLTEYNEEETWRIIAMEERETGSERRLVEQICKKLRKDKDIPQIADEVEEEEKLVKKICDIAAVFAPDYDAEKVFKAVQKKDLKI